MPPPVPLEPSPIPMVELSDPAVVVVIGIWELERSVTVADGSDEEPVASTVLPTEPGEPVVVGPMVETVFVVWSVLGDTLGVEASFVSVTDVIVDIEFVLVVTEFCVVSVMELVVDWPDCSVDVTSTAGETELMEVERGTGFVGVAGVVVEAESDWEEIDGC